MLTIIRKKNLNNLLLCSLLLAPTMVMADEACHWKCNPGQQCGDLDSMTKICQPIPHFSNRQQLYEEAEKIGFVGDIPIKAFEKVSPTYGCSEGYRQSKTYWACSRPMGMTPCGTQIQTIILDMIPPKSEPDPKYAGTKFAMEVGGFRTLLTTNCVEEVGYLNLSLNSHGKDENIPMRDDERFYRKSLVNITHKRIRELGITVNSETEELATRFIEGELTTEQFVVEGLKLYQPQIPKP